MRSAARTTGSLILPAAVLLACAAGVMADLWYGDFVDDRTVVFGPASPLYSECDISSSILAELPAGTEVSIVGAGEGEFRSMGLASYWYRVDCILNGREFSGCIPGSDLAMSDMVMGGDTLFMFNVTGFDTIASRYIGEVRVIGGGEMLDSFTFSPIGGSLGQAHYPYNTELITFDPSGLNGVQVLMRLSFVYGASGYENPDLLVAWTGEDIVLGPEAMNEAEAGVYIYTTRFILPSSRGGEDDMVILESTLQTWDEAIEDYTVSETTMTGYTWIGDSFADQADGDNLNGN